MLAEKLIFCDRIVFGGIGYKIFIWFNLQSILVIAVWNVLPLEFLTNLMPYLNMAYSLLNCSDK